MNGKNIDRTVSWVYYKDEMFKMTAPHLIVEIRYSVMTVK